VLGRDLRQATTANERLEHFLAIGILLDLRGQLGLGQKDDVSQRPGQQIAR
jgi:hypothetical protein